MNLRSMSLLIPLSLVLAIVLGGLPYLSRVVAADEGTLGSLGLADLVVRGQPCDIDHLVVPGGGMARLTITHNDISCCANYGCGWYNHGTGPAKCGLKVRIWSDVESWDVDVSRWSGNIDDTYLLDTGTSGNIYGQYIDTDCADNGPIPPWSATIRGETVFSVEALAFVVNSTGDEEDADPNDDVCDVDLDEDGQQCTLRAAIQCANAQLGENMVTFDIPGEGVPSLLPQNPLPTVGDLITIDATTQPSGTVVLNGTGAGAGTNGLNFTAGGTVKGLVIRDFGGNGLEAFGVDLELHNIHVLENEGRGIAVSTGDLTITGTDNRICGNNEDGIVTEVGDDLEGGSVEIFSAVEILDNCGWGIRADGSVRLGVRDQRSKISNNGRGVGCEGLDPGEDAGGIQSGSEEPPRSGFVTAYNLEVQNNLGPGIDAYGGDVDLEGVHVLENEGRGIAVSSGDLTITGTDNRVSGNNEDGIVAEVGDDLEGGSVEIFSAVEILDNCGWGIRADGSVRLGVRDQRSRVSNNGRGVGCEGLDPGEDAGGIQSGSEEPPRSGFVTAYNLEVQNNLGPGIDAYGGDVDLEGVHVLENEGRGIAVSSGDLTITGTDNRISGNQEDGIVSDSPMAIHTGEICLNQGYGIVAESRVDLQQVKICGNALGGIFFPDSADGLLAGLLNVKVLADAADSSAILRSTIADNLGDGIGFGGGIPLTIIQSNIFDNDGFGINNLDPSVEINAQDNWWGDPDGPGEGDIGGNVDYANWRAAPVIFAVMAGPDVGGARGADVTVAFYIDNLSDSTDTYDITVSDLLGWGLSPTTFADTVQAGEIKELRIAVSIPLDTAEGTEDEVTLTATSVSVPGATDSATLLALAHSPVYSRGAGNALHFDGSTDYVDCGDGPSLIMNQDDFTVEAWIKGDRADRWYVIANKLDVSWEPYYSWWLRIPGNNLVDFMTRHTFPGGTEVLSQQTILPDTWYHIAGVRDGETLEVYINGDLDNSSTGGTLYDLTAAGKLILGARGDDNDGGGDDLTQFFEGVIDEVRIWNVALAEEVLRAWINRKVNDSHPNWDNLVGYWRFDEVSGAIAYDQTSNVNHGVLHMDDGARTISTAPIGDRSHVSMGTSDLLENDDVPVDVIWDDDPGPDAIFAAIQVDEEPDVADGLSGYYPPTYWEFWIVHDDGDFQGHAQLHYDALPGMRNEAGVHLYARIGPGQRWFEIDEIDRNYEGNRADGIGSVSVVGRASELKAAKHFILTRTGPSHAYGDVTNNGDITAYDASYVLQHTVGMRALAGEDSTVADVSGLMGISAYDASLILQYVIDRFLLFPVEEGGVPDPVAKALVSPRIVSLGGVVSREDGRIGVSVLIDEMEGVVSGTLSLTFEGGVGDLRVVETKLTSGYLFAYSAQEDRIRVSFAGAMSREGSGAVLEMVLDAERAELLRSLRLEHVSLNEGRIPVQTVGEDVEIPGAYRLSQNVPNPFNPETIIRYDVAKDGGVRLTVYSLTGQRIRTLVDGECSGGSHFVVWDGRDEGGRDVASGVYLCRMEAGDYHRVRKMLMIR